MKIVLYRSLVLFLLIGSYTVNAQEKQHLFSGGMFLHAGYISNSRLIYPSEGLCNGIGGKLVFHLGSHFRLGTEGYATNMPYRSNDGIYKMGWGGIVGEYQYTIGRIIPVVGLTLGGGEVKDLYFINGSIEDNIPDEAMYKVYSVFLAAPAISLEYVLRDNLKLVCKADYIINMVGDVRNDYAGGPRLYFGVLFRR